MSDITEGRGTDCNRVKIGGITTLFGDKDVRLEKPYTIVRFPGGDVEIARCSDGTYWVHVAKRDGGKIVRARLDAEARYADAANACINREIEEGDVKHIAFLVQP
jgi:hypothetical protein